MIRGAIFDVDGTLLDSMHIWKNVGERYLRSLGIAPRENLSETFKTFTLDQSAEYLRRHYGLSLSVSEISHGINQMIEDFYFGQAQLRPGIKEFLQKLDASGVRMVIATATDRYLVEAALIRCEISHYFGKIVTCKEAGSKESPEIYEQARAFLGTAREDTWVFEDAYHGAKTAFTAGFPVLGVRDPSEENQQGLREVSTVYLEDFQHPDAFWEAVSL